MQPGPAALECVLPCSAASEAESYQSPSVSAIHGYGGLRSDHGRFWVWERAPAVTFVGRVAGWGAVRFENPIGAWRAKVVFSSQVQCACVYVVLCMFTSALHRVWCMWRS